MFYAVTIESASRKRTKLGEKETKREKNEKDDDSEETDDCIIRIKI